MSADGGKVLNPICVGRTLAEAGALARAGEAEGYARFTIRPHLVTLSNPGWENNFRGRSGGIVLISHETYMDDRCEMGVFAIANIHLLAMRIR